LNTINFEKSPLVFSKTLIILLVIILGAIIIRAYYYSFEVPLTSDALGYFFFASDIAISGNLPSNYSPANPGWSMFVSGFFSIFNFETVNEYMQIQKMLSIIISAITVVPIYWLCRRFLDHKFSVIGCILFAFEPHLIQNSLYGITDPLYIFLITLGLSMSLSTNQRIIFLSFFVVGISTYIRAEGLFVFLSILSIILIKEKNDKKKILTISLCIIIFMASVAPIVYYKYSVMEDDLLFMRANRSLSTFTEANGANENSRIETSLENFPKYFGWALIPTLIVFVPLGIVSVLTKKRNFWIIFSASFFIILPMIYSYSIPLKDVRFVFYIYPILILISMLGINHISEKFSNAKITSMLVIGFIIVSSVTFLELKIEDQEIQKDAFYISQILVSSPKSVNSFYPESSYIETAEIPSEWEKFKEVFEVERENKISIREGIQKNLTIFETNNFQSLENMILETQLTHIVADDREDRPEFIKNVFVNGESIKYLEKEFDSRERNLKYNVKIFKINYELLN